MTVSTDAILLSVAETAVVPCPVRLGWRRRYVRGLSLRQIVALADRYPAARETVLGMFGLSLRPELGEVPEGGAAIVDVLATAIGRRDVLTGRRIASLSGEDFKTLALTVRRLTVPTDIGEFFEPVARSSDDDDADADMDDSLWHEPVYRLAKTAELLAAQNFQDPFGWTPGRLTWVASVLGEDEAARSRRDLLRQASAGQAAKIEDNNKWAAWVAKLRR